MSMLALPERSVTSLDVIHRMDALTLLRALPSGFVDCVVTSPPYYALRDYGVDGQIGLEATPQLFIERLMQLFREVHRVLKPTGSVWVNLGDSYANDTKWGGYTGGKHVTGLHGQSGIGRTKTSTGLPPKSLMMIPARFAIAMQDEGWILRSECIWHKPNPMPESVTDRPTKAHEMVYLFAKEPRYWYDQAAVREPHSQIDRRFGGDGSHFGTGVRYHSGAKMIDEHVQRGVWMGQHPDGRNLRSVWTIIPEPFAESHFAVMPSKLVETCVKAGCPVGGVVLDMFMGSGTTAITARRLGRHYIGSDLNPEYVQMARKRLAQTDPFMDKQVTPELKQRSLFAGASL